MLEPLTEKCQKAYFGTVVLFLFVREKPNMIGALRTLKANECSPHRLSHS
jgi:hypothetical protein